MLMVIECLAVLLSLLVLAPVAVIFLQLIAALPASRRHPHVSDFRPRVTVLIPAHDEVVVIAKTLRSLRSQLRNGDRILVVADNCSDQTANIARRLGAEVIERFDSSLRGKGYALDFGIRHIAIEPPSVVIMVDADCVAEPGSIDHLARDCQQSGRPVQALYLMRAPDTAGVGLRVAEFAWILRNHVRPLGYHRLGLPCQLMGTGMAFPWQTISSVPLASGHIVEDMKLGIDLALSGTPAQFCPDALVTSTFPLSKGSIQTQRTRWEHGHIGIILKYGPKLLLQGLAKLDIRLLALGLDLCVPPLALLAGLVLVVSVIDGVVSASVGDPLPWLLASVIVTMFATFLLLAWSFYGRKVLSLGDLAYMPIYALGKIPMYLKFVVGKQVEWVRSSRDDA